MVETRECRFCLRQSHLGIEVWGVFMCGSCEDVLLQVPVGGERYMYFLEILKEARQSCDIAFNECT
jgi:hypothetical protein